MLQMATMVGNGSVTVNARSAVRSTDKNVTINQILQEQKNSWKAVVERSKGDERLDGGAFDDYP